MSVLRLTHGLVPVCRVKPVGHAVEAEISQHDCLTSSLCRSLSYHSLVHRVPVHPNVHVHTFPSEQLPPFEQTGEHIAKTKSSVFIYNT